MIIINYACKISCCWVMIKIHVMHTITIYYAIVVTMISNEDNRKQWRVWQNGWYHHFHCNCVPGVRNKITRYPPALDSSGHATHSKCNNASYFCNLLRNVPVCTCLQTDLASTAGLDVQSNWV
jgi:hypothetical protein